MPQWNYHIHDPWFWVILVLHNKYFACREKWTSLGQGLVNPHDLPFLFILFRNQNIKNITWLAFLKAKTRNNFPSKILIPCGSTSDLPSKNSKVLHRQDSPTLRTWHLLDAKLGCKHIWRRCRGTLATIGKVVLFHCKYPFLLYFAFIFICVVLLSGVWSCTLGIQTETVNVHS